MNCLHPKTRGTPSGCYEALSRLNFATIKFVILPELQCLCNFVFLWRDMDFELVSSLVEPHPSSGANKHILEKLLVISPTRGSKFNLMKEMEQEFNHQWDSSIEKELCNPIED